MTNEFHFECLGYRPIDPHLGTLDPLKAESESSKDYQSKQRSTWALGFSYVPK